MKVLDDEHNLCSLALTRLAKERSIQALQHVFDMYTQHFAHEEELLDLHLYSEAIAASTKTSGFSGDGNARTSHFTDHKRLLKDVRTAILKLEGRRKEGSDTPIVELSFVNKVLRDFESHANTFDDAYAERLSAALGEGGEEDEDSEGEFLMVE